MGDRCIYCGAPAERWCDFVIGYTDPDGDGLASLDDGELMRCDSPLCLAHARDMGRFFISGGKHSCADSIDHCVGHDDEDWFALTAGDAAAWRIAHRLRAQGGLRIVTALPAATTGDHHG